MDLTRRLTWPDEDRPNDWTILYRGVAVARYYSDSHHGQKRWQWFINFTNAGLVERLAQRGIEETEDACKDTLRGVLEQYEAAGAIRTEPG